MKEQGKKTHPGRDDAFAERDTHGVTNELSHNRDGNILYRLTKGYFAHLEVCILKNRQCGIKQCLRNGCIKKVYYMVVSTTNQLHIAHQA